MVPAERAPARGARADAARSFFARTCDARKLLVIGSGALGDAIHALPALRQLRDAYPQAALHVVAAAPAFYESLTPWVDRAWPPVARRFIDNGVLLRQLRAERYDAVVVIHAHNTMVLLAALTGAPVRLTRKADFNKRWYWQPWAMTHVVDEPFHTRPMYRQLVSVLHGAGIPGGVPRFDVTVRDEALAGAGIARQDFGTYVHASLLTTNPSKELPAAQRAELVAALIARYPRVVLSCGATPREIRLLGELAAALPRPPWRIFPGTLGLPQFVALVARAGLHVGGDSGGLHAARLCGTPTVVWARQSHHVPNWVPAPEESGARVLLSADGRRDALHGITTEAILGAAAALTPRGVLAA